MRAVPLLPRQQRRWSSGVWTTSSGKPRPTRRPACNKPRPTKKGRCTVPTNPICVVGNSWMRAEIESNSTKMRKACVEVTQAFRDFKSIACRSNCESRSKDSFFTVSKLSLRALPFLGPLAAYRGVDPGCHGSSLLTAYIDITR